MVMIPKVNDSILPGSRGLDHFCFPFSTANVPPRQNEKTDPIKPFAHPSIGNGKEKFLKYKINIRAI